MNTSAPSGGDYASFATNGTNASKSDVVTFHEIGTYSFAVTITDAGGLSVTSGMVTATVTQSQTSVTVSPSPAELSAGQTKQLTATAYDQFGAVMNAQPVFSWSVTSGAGTVSPAGIYTAPATGTLATVTATAGSQSAASTVSVVNVPWTASDIGTVATPGTAYDSGSTTTLTNSSDDIWNQSDDFQFDYQEVAGNVTITAELNSQTSVSTYIKAGVMIRSSLAANSSMGMISNPSPGIDFEYRTSTNATAAQTVGGADSTPYWLQLTLVNGTITGYGSPNGTTWTQIGSQAITVGTNVYVGLALTSHDTSALATAVFSHVSIVTSPVQVLTSVKVLTTPQNLTAGKSQQLIAEGFDQNGFLMSTQPAFTWTLTSGAGNISSSGLYTAPSTGTLATVTASSGGLTSTGSVAVVNSPWTSTDIGVVNAPGTAYDSGSTTTLTDTSDDIWNQSDDFHFDYQTMTGNGSITAELNSQTSASSYIKSGLMMRNSLSPDDVMAMICNPSTAPVFEWRTSASVIAQQDLGPTAEGTPYYLRLVRNGSLFSGYISANGTTGWTLIGSQTLSMNSVIYVGLALTSHDTAASATAVFSHVSISNPTVATAASATPNPATGSTTALSVLGANTPNSSGEASLTYTWAATSTPSGATTPTFSVNGTNAAKNTIATFSKAGAYVFTVTITDTVGETVTSSVAVNVVSQTLTSITITPSNSTIPASGTQTFTAVANDQFGNPLATQPSFTWAVSSGIGSISTTGVYTAPAAPGSATITATSSSVVGTTSITVNNTPPVVTTPAAVTPSPVTGTTATLSVAGTSDLGAANLTYTWYSTTIPGGAAVPTFTVNGNNAASTTVATFTKAGSYKFIVVLTDSQGATASSSVSVTVNATLTTVSLSSNNIALGGTTQASAFDQFNNAIASPTWSAIGGTITSAGLYTAGNAGGNFSITATSNGTSLSANLTVLSTSFTGTAGNDTYVLRVSPTNAGTEQLFVNTPETGSPTYTFALSQVMNLSFTTASDGSLTIDFANGNPLPSGGISFTGGATLTIAGASTGGMSFNISDTQIVDNAAASSPIAYTNVAAVNFNLLGGSNSLTQTAQPLTVMTYNAGPLNNTLTINGGSYTFAADPQIADGNLTINDNAQLILSPMDADTGYFICHLTQLNVSSNAIAEVAASADATDRTVLVTSGLSIAQGGTLNLANNAVILHNGDVNAITAMIASGYNAGGGYWNGTGINSSVAAGDSTHLTQLGVILNSQSGAPFYTTFDTQAVVATDVLIKYTYAGDTNLDGKVDGSDYSRIDSAILTGATGWFNGDFNYDGVVDGSDYTLMDNAFNAQGSPLPKKLATLAQVAAMIAPAVAPPVASPAVASKSPVRTATSAATATSLFANQTPISIPSVLQDSVQTLLQKKDLLDRLTVLAGGCP